MQRPVVTVLATLAAFGAGCGVFKSSTSQASWESSSNSSSSFSKSSSNSSKGDETKEALQRDVQTLVAAHAAHGGDAGALRRDLGAVAETHGVTDWERSDDVLVAVGRGLAQAGVDRAQAEAVGRDLGGSRQSAALVMAGWSNAGTR